MKSTLISLSLLAMATLAHAQSTRTVFENTGPQTAVGNSRIVDMEVLRDGNIAVLQHISYGNFGAHLSIVSQTGNVIRSTFVRGWNIDFEVTDLEVGSDGKLYVFGGSGRTATSTASPDAAGVRIYLPDLHEDLAIWADLGTQVSECKVVDGVVDVDGNITFTGSFNDRGTVKMFTTHVNANGAHAWTYTSTGIGRGFGVAVTPTKDLIVAAELGNGVYTALFQRTTGSVVNQNTLFGPTNTQGVDFTSRNGTVGVLAYRLVGNPPRISEVMTRRIDSMNATIWSDSYSVPQTEIVDAIGLEYGLGNELVVGLSRRPTNSNTNTPWLRRFSATGTQLASRTFPNLANSAQTLDFYADNLGNMFWLHQRQTGVLNLESFSGTLGQMLSAIPYSWSPAAGTRKGVIRVIPETGAIVCGRSILGTGLWTRMTSYNQAPVAAADAYSGPGNAVLSPKRSVLANDWYAVGSTATVESAPNVGTLVLRPNGRFDYTPPQGFTGTVTFRYRATKAFLSPSVGTVTLTIQ